MDQSYLVVGCVVGLNPSSSIIFLIRCNSFCVRYFINSLKSAGTCDTGTSTCIQFSGVVQWDVGYNVASGQGDLAIQSPLGTQFGSASSNFTRATSSRGLKGLVI